MRRIPTACLIGLCATLLTACARDQAGFPSLARRPAERINTPAPDTAPAPQTTPAPLDPAVLALAEEQVARARAADARFASRLAQTRALVAAAAGAEVASETWSVATVALSELEAARSEAMIALAAIDEVYARAVIDGTDSAALARARDTVVGLVAAQDRVLAELGGQLAD